MSGCEETPVLAIAPRDRRSGWMTTDMRDEEGVDAVVVIPLFGPDHRAGMDCWCSPVREDGVITHNAVH